MIIKISPSERMDTNKKDDRDERSLIRMPAQSRSAIGHEEGYPVEVWAGDDVDSRLNTSLVLTPFMAYSDDIRVAKQREGYQEGDVLGFVTSENYKRLSSGAKEGLVFNVTSGIHGCILGCDPEFLLFEGDEIVDANRVMPKQGRVGSDAVMAELRPAPSLTPSGLIANIKDILTEDCKVIDKYDWKAACCYRSPHRPYYVGGHIHINTPAIIGRKLASETQRRPLFGVMNKIIDEYVSMPMVRLDGKEGSLRRNARDLMGPFGHFGGWRFCDGRLEHRTLSGMWLSHPNIAEPMFGVVQCVVDSIFIHIENSVYSTDMLHPKIDARQMYNSDFDSWDQIPLAKNMGCTRSSGEVREWLHSSLPGKVTKAYLSSWKQSLGTLPAYTDETEEHVRVLTDILSTPVKDLEKTSRDIRRNWF